MTLDKTTIALVAVILVVFIILSSSHPDYVLEQVTPRVAGASVLVTGGLGFIGSHVVEELVAQNASVVILDNETTGHNFPPEGVVIVKGDVTDARVFEKIPHVDYVIHLAAVLGVQDSFIHPDKYMKVNVEGISHSVGSHNVYNFAAKRMVKGVVSASSASIFGNVKDLPVVESSEIAPISPYGESKSLMEKLSEEYSRDTGRHSVSIRYFNVYGPRQDPKSDYTGVISAFLATTSLTALAKAKAGKQIEIFGDGEQTRDFVFVRDIARITVRALMPVIASIGCDTPGVGNGCHFPYFNLNIGTGIEYSVNEVAATIIKSASSSSTIEHVDARKGDIARSVSGVQKAIDLFSFSPLGLLGK